jgi:acetyl esterase/lipase
MSAQHSTLPLHPVRLLLYPVILLGCLFTNPLVAQESIRLWPENKMPNSKGMALEELNANERITQVGTPRIEALFPSTAENKGAAVVICPGGGYQRLAYVGAGLQLAKWFNTFGVTAFVLIYRLPTSPDLIDRNVAPLQDAQRAVRMVRANAARWGIQPQKIGVMGTSAGGHLAATVSTRTEDVSAIGDSLDAFSFRPDFMILISPVITLGKDTHAGSRDNLLGPNPSPALVAKYSNERQVNKSTPPAFLVHAVDDKVVPMQNSLLFHSALVENGINASLHVFPHGAHMIALRDNPGSTALWTALCEAWLKEMGFLADPRL